MYLECVLPGYDKPTPRPKKTTHNTQNQTNLQLTHNAIFNFPLPDVTACNFKFSAHFADPLPFRDIYWKELYTTVSDDTRHVPTRL